MVRARWRRCPSIVLHAFTIAAFLIGSIATAEETRHALSPDLSSGPCAPNAVTLCLNDSRFSVAVSWQVPDQGRSGQGTSVPLSDDTGLFWFFDGSDIDLVVKILDGTAVNGRYWVFFAGLSNVGYEIAVTDLETGGVKSYENPSGTFASVADTLAFAGSFGAVAGAETVRVETDGPALQSQSRDQYAQLEALPKAAQLNPCAPGSSTLCLLSSRFQLTVDWEAPSLGLSGHGTAVPISTDTGYFWFSRDSNIELTVKVVDGRPINGHFWIFVAALSNVKYTLRVTDTQTGLTKAWDNPEGQLVSWADTEDFSDSVPPPPPPPPDLSGTWTGTMTVRGGGPRESAACSSDVTVDLAESGGNLTGQFGTGCGFFSLSGLIQGGALSGSLYAPDGQAQISGGPVSSNRIQFQATLREADDRELIAVSLSR
jgi:hypothetical protein